MTWDTERDERFEECFIGLAKALRVKPDAKDLEIYASALSSLPIEAIEMGANALRIQVGRRFFPSTAEWFGAAAAVIQREREETERAARGGERAERWPDCPQAREFFATMRKVLASKAMR